MEFKAMMTDLGKPMDYVLTFQMISEFDSNKSGVIELPEFLTMMASGVMESNY